MWYVKYIIAIIFLIIYVTKVNDSNKPIADRSAHEIEITQEMIEAGRKIWDAWDSSDDFSRTPYIKAIYYEMFSLRNL